MVLFLETCTAEVSSGRACPEEGKPSPVEEAARKDSAVHVSLSSDSLVKQPGDHGGPPSRCAGKPPKPKPSDRNRTTGHLISEELRRRAIAPESGAARRCGGFIWAGRRACQHQMPQISPQLRAVEQRCLSHRPAHLQEARAALAPHSSRVVRIGERPVVTARITGRLAAR